MRKRRRLTYCSLIFDDNRPIDCGGFVDRYHSAMMMMLWLAGVGFGASSVSEVRKVGKLFSLNKILYLARSPSIVHTKIFFQLC